MRKWKRNSCNVFPLFFYIGNIVTRFLDRTTSVGRRLSLPMVVSVCMRSIRGRRNELVIAESRAVMVPRGRSKLDAAYFPSNRNRAAGWPSHVVAKAPSAARLGSYRQDDPLSYSVP